MITIATNRALPITCIYIFIFILTTPSSERTMKLPFSLLAFALLTHSATAKTKSGKAVDAQAKARTSQQRHAKCLYNNHFIDGTLIIDQPGAYK